MRVRYSIQIALAIFGFYLGAIYNYCSHTEEIDVCRFALFADGYPICSIHAEPSRRRTAEELEYGFAYQRTIRSFGVRVGQSVKGRQFVPNGTGWPPPHPLDKQYLHHDTFGEIPVPYLPFASAVTIVIASLPNLLSARRKWINRTIQPAG